MPRKASAESIRLARERHKAMYAYQVVELLEKRESVERFERIRASVRAALDEIKAKEATSDAR